MDKNPEEGRVTKEREAELVRNARRRTVEMRRQYRDDRRKQEAQIKAHKWAERHAEAIGDADTEMVRIASSKGPGNRRERRYYAKKSHAFKIPGGWQSFNEMYRQRCGYQQSVSRRPKRTSILSAIAEGVTE